MHGDMLMYFFKKSIYCFPLQPPSSSSPQHRTSRRLHPRFCFPTHSRLTLSLSGFYCQQPSSPRSPLTSMFPKPVGLFPALPDSIPWGIHIGQTLPSSSAVRSFHAVTYQPPCRSSFSFLCRPRFLCSFLLPFTVCLDFSLAICEYILTLKDTNSTEVSLFFF